MENKKLFIIAAFIFIFDRISKEIIIRQNILYYPLIKNFLEITPTNNTGAAFSLFQGQQILLIIASTVAISFLIQYLFKKKLCLLQQAAWGILLGGAFGNLFDRVIHNGVIDFINLAFIKFPVFNLADMAITLGTLVVIFSFEGKNNA